MPSQSHSIVQQFTRWKTFKYPLLWLSAAGIAATMIWLPLINAMMCISFFLLWGYYCRFRFRIENKLQVFLFTSVYLITAISFFYAENTSEALRLLQLKLPLLLFPIAFASGIDWRKDQIRLLLLIFSWSVSLFCIITIGNAILLTLSSGNVQAMFGYNIIPFKFLYASVFSLFCVFSAVIHLNEMTEKRKFSPQHLLPLFLTGTVLILLSNRMGLFLCTIIAVVFIFRMVSSVIVKWLIALMLLFVLLSTYTSSQAFQEKVRTIIQFNPEQMVPLDQDASLGRSWDGLYLRLAIWDCASDIIQQNFWLGVGSGDVQTELQKSYENRKFYFASKHNKYNAHNQFIEQWIMTGFFGFLIFVASLLIPLFKNLQSGLLLYSAFLIIFIFYCCTESMLEITKGAVWFSFFNSIFAFQVSDD